MAAAPPPRRRLRGKQPVAPNAWWKDGACQHAGEAPNKKEWTFYFFLVFVPSLEGNTVALKIFWEPAQLPFNSLGKHTVAFELFEKISIVSSFRIIKGQLGVFPRN